MTCEWGMGLGVWGKGIYSSFGTMLTNFTTLGQTDSCPSLVQTCRYPILTFPLHYASFSFLSLAVGNPILPDLTPMTDTVNYSSFSSPENTRYCHGLLGGSDSNIETQELVDSLSSASLLQEHSGISLCV